MTEERDELLVALFARVIKTEATVCTLASLFLEHMANPTRDQSFDTVSTAFAQFRAQMIRSQLESLIVQFPELTKLLKDHVMVSEADLKDFLRSPQEQV
ncbi:MAG: hypothetical protein AVDCRST_MAG42-766 [uncultured Chthoniobacterales bacterium]|uniref:Uncharacterized protein n=1 Tax=uncultured Chthoniobacterales bacterium TaxID=1836801 RepID=A0A6J4GXE6_9BACT|nr:MAG: hypothetical protein AVDCRST_MAG42-766 [uncultured Chthoniobacterales bacterium]